MFIKGATQHVTRRRIILAVCLLVVAALTYKNRWRLYALVPGSWENTGDYNGSLTRAPVRYDPSKPPSRPWLDPQRTAPAPLTYHTYSAASINGQETDYLLYLPPGYDDPANAARRYPVIYWLHGYSVEPQYGTPFVET